MILFLQNLLNESHIKVLITVIALDTILGILRAIRERSINSSIGIDGIIRKTGMLITVIFLSFLDLIVNVNLIAFLPETIKTAFNLEKIGITNLFTFLYIIFEILSVFKNAILCKLPIPIKLQKTLERIMKEFTEEIKQ